MRRLRSLLRGPFLSFLGLVGGLLLWELGGRMKLSPALPPITDVFRAVADVWTREQFVDGFVSTLTSVAIAFPPSVALAIAVGLLMGRFRIVEWMFDIHVNIFLSLPLVALIPVILLIFGLGRPTVIVTIVIYVFFVVVVNTFSGVKTTDETLVEMAHSFGANGWQIMRRVVIPSAMPLILTGVRIGVGRAIKGVIIAEQVIGLVGLGGLIQRLGGAFQVEELYAVILFVGLLGLLSMEVIRGLERVLLPGIRSREKQAAAEPAGG
jgi:NitT/TauT family transport system permease protein